MKKRRHGFLRFFLCFALIIFIITGPYYLVFYRPQEADYNAQKQSLEWVGIISFWDYPNFDYKSGTNYGWINEKIKAFEKANPGVYIDFEPIDREKGAIRLNTAAKMGTAPDIMPLSPDVNLIGRGILEPLDDYFSVEEIRNFKEGALKAVTYNGSIWGAPWMMSGYTMILNLNMFRERNVEPPKDGQWTYEEFVAKLKELTYSSGESKKIDRYGFNSFIQPGYYNVWGLLLSDGAEIFDEKMNYSFNDEKALRGVKKLLDLKLIYGVTPPEFGENSSGKAWNSFSKDQKVAVYPTGTWALRSLERLKQEGTGFEYGVADFPKGSMKEPMVMGSTIGAYAMSKQEDPKKREMCVKFIKFLIEDEHQEQLHRLGVFPVKKSIGNIYEGDSQMTLFYEQMENLQVPFAHPYWLEIDNILQREIQQGLLGKKSPEELLKDAEEKIQILLHQAGN